MSWVTSTMVVPNRLWMRQEVVLRLGPDDRVEGAERLVHQQHFWRRPPGRARRRRAAAGRRRARPATGRGKSPGRAANSVSSSSTRAAILACPSRAARHRADVLRHGAMREQAVPLDGVADAAAQLVHRLSRVSRPSIRTRPALGSTSRLIIRSSVVLPEPEVPTTATISPSSMLIDTSSTTVAPSKAW